MSFSQLKLLKSPIVLASSILTLFYCLIDLNSVELKTEPVGRTYSISDLQGINYKYFSKEEALTIKKMYEQYRVPEEASEQNNSGTTLSQAELAAQSGIVKNFYVDDVKLSLKAIIQDNSEVDTVKVLLNVENMKTKEAGVEAFSVKDLVYGYRLTVTAMTQVELHNEENKQTVVLSMYEPLSNQ